MFSCFLVYLYQMFNFKDALAFTNDLISTFSNQGIEDICHTEVKLATPLRSFIHSEQDFLRNICTLFLKAVFPHLLLWSSSPTHVPSSGTRLTRIFPSPIRCQMKTRYRVFHWVSWNSTYMIQTQQSYWKLGSWLINNEFENYKSKENENFPTNRLNSHDFVAPLFEPVQELGSTENKFHSRFAAIYNYPSKSIRIWSYRKPTRCGASSVLA